MFGLQNLKYLLHLSSVKSHFVANDSSKLQSVIEIRVSTYLQVNLGVVQHNGQCKSSGPKSRSEKLGSNHPSQCTFKHPLPMKHLCKCLFWASALKTLMFTRSNTNFYDHFRDLYKAIECGQVNQVKRWPIGNSDLVAVAEKTVWNVKITNSERSWFFWWIQAWRWAWQCLRLMSN